MSAPLTRTTVEVGDYVTRPGSDISPLQQIQVGRILAIRDGVAYIVGRTTALDPYRLIETAADTLELAPEVSGPIDVGIIGQVYVEKAATLADRISDIRDARDQAQRDLDTERDRYAEREAEAEALRREVANLRSREGGTATAEANARLAMLRDQYESFQRDVRDLAIQKAGELGWCRSGLNEALEQLGLEPHSDLYRVPVEVIVRRTLYVEVNSSDDRQAWRDVDAMSGYDLMERLEGDDVPEGWEHYSHDAATSGIELVED